MILDYFDILANILDFTHSEYCYVVNIIVRRKNNVNDWIKYHLHDVNRHIIKYYLIDSKESLLSIKNEVVDLCLSLNARAYIEPALHKKDILNDNIKTYLASVNYNLQPLEEVYNTIDNFDSSDICLYVGVDLDEENALPENYQKYLDVVTEVNPNAVLLADFPTPNGKWLLYTSFDTTKFNMLINEYKYNHVGVGSYGGIPLYSNLK